MSLGTAGASGPSPSMVGRPQPQTTIEKAGGPFIRYTQPGNLPQYIASAVAFGGMIQQPLVARPGYYRDFRLCFAATGGVNGTNTVALQVDAGLNSNGLGLPTGLVANVASLLQFKDPFGTLIFSLPSFEMYVVQLAAGGAGCGLGGAAFPGNLPSFSAASTGASGTGNFQWALTLPLEFAKGVGTAPGANASVQPTLQIQLNTSANIYSTAPGTLPTVQVDVESDFYWLPEGNQIAPPALGTSRQWILQQGNPTIASASNTRVSFPRLGGYLDTLIIEGRDSSTNLTRTSFLPGFTGSTAFTAPAVGNTSRFVLYIDGVPIDDNPMWKALDDQYIAFRGQNMVSGTFTWTRKTSLSQQTEGLLDTGEATLSSNPGTLIEVQGQPWGTFSNGPVTLNVIVGQIVPRGRMVTGLPEV